MNQQEVSAQIRALYETLIIQSIGNATAGGLINQETQRTQYGKLRFDCPATGDLKLTTNFTDRCWLKCEGQEVSTNDYPELYSVIGNKFGTPSTVDVFKLPARADLPTIPTSGIDWAIRT